MEITNFSRKCPSCQKDLFYKSQKGLDIATNANSLCSSCCQLSPERRRALVPAGEKFCKKCGKVKSLLDFYNSSKTSDRKQAHCKECQNIYKLEWDRENPDKAAETKKRHKDKDPEGFNEYHRNWKRKKWEEGVLQIPYKRYRIRALCDMTIEQENWILDWKGGNCPICGTYMTERGAGGSRANIDHDHSNRKFRDLICSACNTMLGHAKDSPEILINAASYLRKHKNVDLIGKIAA